MAGPERVLDEEVAVRRQPARELRVVLLLAGLESQVLEEDHRAGGRGAHEVARALVERLIKERHAPLEQLLETARHRSQRELRRALPLGAPQVGGQHEDGSPLAQRGQGRNGGADPDVASHAPLLRIPFQRHVVVDPHQRPASGHLVVPQVVDRPAREHYRNLPR